MCIESEKALTRTAGAEANTSPDSPDTIREHVFGSLCLLLQTDKTAPNLFALHTHVYMNGSDFM